MTGMLNTVTQAVALSAFSNILAQLITAYQDKTPYANLNAREILIFVGYTIINTPLNVYWQDWLESAFPSTQNAPGATSKSAKQVTETPVAAKSLNLKNTAIKFALDQTIGAAFNITLFVASIGILKGLSYDQIVEALRKDSWPMYAAGAKVWPAASLISFAFVPVERRVIFGALVGVAWGVFLSLRAR